MCTAEQCRTVLGAAGRPDNPWGGNCRSFQDKHAAHSSPCRECRAFFAGFHSAALYHALRGAVKPLTELLTDDEYKTRANAAGALGNLVRNSSMLCEPIVQAGALQVTCTCASAPCFCIRYHLCRAGIGSGMLSTCSQLADHPLENELGSVYQS